MLSITQTIERRRPRRQPQRQRRNRQNGIVARHWRRLWMDLPGHLPATPLAADLTAWFAWINFKSRQNLSAPLGKGHVEGCSDSVVSLFSVTACSINLRCFSPPTRKQHQAALRVPESDGRGKCLREKLERFKKNGITTAATTRPPSDGVVFFEGMKKRMEEEEWYRVDRLYKRFRLNV